LAAAAIAHGAATGVAFKSPTAGRIASRATAAARAAYNAALATQLAQYERRRGGAGPAGEF